MAFLTRVLKIAVKYGSKAISWVWRNKKKIMDGLIYLWEIINIFKSL